MSKAPTAKQSLSIENWTARGFLFCLFILLLVMFGRSFGLDVFPMFATKVVIPAHSGPNEATKMPGVLDHGPYDSDLIELDLPHEITWMRIRDLGIEINAYAGDIKINSFMHDDSFGIAGGELDISKSQTGLLIRSNTIFIMLQKSDPSLGEQVEYRLDILADSVGRDQNGIAAGDDVRAMVVEWNRDESDNSWKARLEGSAPVEAFEVALAFPNPLPVVTGSREIRDGELTIQAPGQSAEHYEINLVPFGGHEWLSKPDEKIHLVSSPREDFISRVTTVDGRWAVELTLTLLQSESGGPDEGWISRSNRAQISPNQSNSADLPDKLETISLIYAEII